VGLKLNGTHQLLAYADDVNLLGVNIDIIKKNTGTLIDASKEVGLEINVEKTKYMLLSRHQNVGQNRNKKIANLSFENVSQFKYLGTTVEVGCGDVDWIGLAQDRNRWRALINAVLNLWVPRNAGKLSSGLSNSAHLHRVSYVLSAFTR
jgi:hypothetical protein